MTGHRGLVQAVHTHHTGGTYPSYRRYIPSYRRYIPAMQMVHIRHAGDTYPPCKWYISVMQTGSVRQSSLP